MVEVRSLEKAHGAGCSLKTEAECPEWCEARDLCRRRTRSHTSWRPGGKPERVDTHQRVSTCRVYTQATCRAHMCAAARVSQQPRMARMSRCGCGRRKSGNIDDVYVPWETRWPNIHMQPRGRQKGVHSWLRLRPPPLRRMFLLAIIGMMATRAAAQFKEDSPLYIREVQKQEVSTKEST